MEEFFEVLADRLFSHLSQNLTTNQIKELSFYSWACYHAQAGGKVDPEILAEVLEFIQGH